MLQSILYYPEVSHQVLIIHNNKKEKEHAEYYAINSFLTFSKKNGYKI